MDTFFLTLLIALFIATWGGVIRLLYVWARDEEADDLKYGIGETKPR